MADKEVKYEITGDATQFVKAAEAAATAVQTASKEIDSQFKRIGDAFTAIQKQFVAFTAVVAGGGALKKLISDAAGWNTEAGKMAAQLGITTQQASVLNVALQRLGIDADVYTGAAQKLSKQIFSNAAAFQTLGVQVKDVTTGAYRPVTEVMGEVNAKLAAIKNPIEQNIAGQQVYGKGWQEVRGILKLTAEQMAVAEKRARDLGLIVGPEGVAAGKQYQAQMRDLTLVGKSLELQFGNALLPIFTATGSWMAGEGPQFAKVFGDALQFIVEQGIKVWYTFQGLGQLLGGVFAAAGAALSGNFSGAADVLRQTVADIDGLGDKANQAIAKLRAGAGANGAPPDASAGPHYEFKPEKDGAAGRDDRMRQWEAQLAARRDVLQREAALDGTFREMGKGEEAAYWKSILDTLSASDTQRAAVERKYYAAQAEVRKQAFEAGLEQLRVDRDAAQKNYSERIALATEAYTRVAAAYGAESKEARKAYGEILAEQRAFEAQRRTLEAAAAEARRGQGAAAIELERGQAQERQQLGLITTAQLLQQEQGYEQRLFELKLEGLRERRALIDPDRDPVAYDQINRQIEAAELQHQQTMSQLKSKLKVEQLAPQTNIFKSIEDGMLQVGNTLLTNWRNVGQQLRSVLAGIAQNIIMETVIKPQVARAAAWLKERAMTLAGVEADAVKAGSGAAASQASIPYVGPILAIAAMAAIMAQVRGASAGVPSAEGGFDIPASVNPLVQLHEKEMVLPAQHADTIRALGEMGGLGGGSSPNVVLQAHPMPGNYFLVHQTKLVEALNTIVRNRAWTPK